MITSQASQQLPAALIFLIVILAAWEMAWKGVALWKAGRNNQLPWYIFIFIFNTVGILPIVYLAFFQKIPSVD